MQSRAKRLLVGCGIGCAAMLVLGVGSCISVVVWLNQPGELLDPSRLLGDDTTGYVEWTLHSEDPGTMEFAQRMLDAFAKQQSRHRSPLPPLLDGWLSERQRRKNEKGLQDLFPTVVAWTLRPGETGEDDLHLLSASVASLGHRLILADLLMGFFFGWSEEIETFSHQGEKIYRVPLAQDRSAVFFIRRGSVFFTSDVETSRRALDRLSRDSVGGREATELERLFAEVPQGALRGAVSNRNGELARLWDAWADTHDEVDWSRLVGATVSGGFTAHESLHGVLELHAADPATARRLEPGVVDALRQALAGTPVDLDGQVMDRKIEIRFSIEEIPQKLERWLEGLEQAPPPGA